MLLHEIVGGAARHRPHDPAVIWDDEITSFGALHQRIRRLASRLGELTDPGDRVGVLAHNHPVWIDAYYAVPAAGRVLVFLNQRQHPREWEALLERTGTRVLIAQSDLAERLREEASLGPVQAVLGVEDRPAADAPDGDGGWGPGTAEPDEVAWVIFTSGTTAAPKGAMLTHRSLLAAISAGTAARPVAADAVYAYPFPLCHVAGYNILLHHLHGRPVVLLPGFSPEAVCGAVAQHRASTVSLAPSMIAALLDSPALEAADLSSLRTVSYGASAIPGEVLRAGLERLGCDFTQGYGMTELSGNAVFLGPEEHRRAVSDAPHLLAAAGRPAPAVEVRIVDDAGRDVAPGAEGEIAVRADQVMAGYWDDPQGTEAAFLTDGAFLTGDVGRFDEAGYLYVVDRKKDVIVTGGENVASREVEDVLHQHPAVAAAAVVGLPHRRWGEQVTAAVVTRSGATTTEAELEAFVRDRLAGYKVPRRVWFVDELPTNASGKVLKRVLRDELADQPQAEGSQPRSSAR